MRITSATTPARIRRGCPSTRPAAISGGRIVPIIAEPALTIASMTGFARHQAAFPEAAGGGALTWELRSVNGRGLDVRARLPAGWDELDGPVRQAVGAVLTRGNVSLSLTVESDRAQAAPAVNHALLDQLAAVAADGRPAPSRFAAGAHRRAAGHPGRAGGRRVGTHGPGIGRPLGARPSAGPRWPGWRRRLTDLVAARRGRGGAAGNGVARPA